MPKSIFRLTHEKEYARAGPEDLVEMESPPGSLPLILPRKKIEIVALAIVEARTLHISGPSGSGKSTLIDYLCKVPANFFAALRGLEIRESRPPQLYCIEMATFDSPGELYFRRALREGATFDEDSILVKALRDAERRQQDSLPVIWLRELGRTHAASIQGGLLDLITPNAITLPDDTQIRVAASWIADSNYQVEEEATHSLVPFDEALKRRFAYQVTLPWLSAEQEVEVLRRLLARRLSEAQRNRLGEETVRNVVKLGNVIRARRAESTLASLVPPTIFNYLAFLELLARTNWSAWDAACVTLIGNVSSRDAKLLPAVFNEAFGLEVDAEVLAESTAGSLF